MSVEQGWGLDWVWRKTGKGPRPQVAEVPGGGPMAVEGVPTPVGTPRLRPDKEVHWLWEEVEGLREDVQVARQERDKAAQARNMSLKLWEVQVEEVEQLWARLMWEAAGSSTGAPGFMEPSAQEVEELAQGLRQANESESRQRDWLLREVVTARLGLGAPAAPGWSVLGHVVRGGGAGGAGNGHKGGAGSGALVKAFMDGLWTPPSLEIVQAAWESLEAEFGPGGGQGETQEGGSGGGA
ncbi:hypothetical protein C0992_005720 [Termitomyces sp. T32_za158]|nr:hypothetical protein C0992_005720 [Termitomyces sp. T32_za158]